MRTPLVAGNWKMHGQSGLEPGAAGRGAGGDRKRWKASNAPYACLIRISAKWPGSLAKTRLAWGAQNLERACAGRIHGRGLGADAGGVRLPVRACRAFGAAPDLRRNRCGGRGEIRGALAQGMTPILCLGETLEERESRADGTDGRAATGGDVEFEQEGSFKNAVVAYEPVWAIGTGRTARPEQVQAVHAFLRTQGACRNPHPVRRQREARQRAGDLFAMKDVDGGLIGGASLLAGEFIAIVGCGARRATKGLNQWKCGRTSSSSRTC